MPDKIALYEDEYTQLLESLKANHEGVIASLDSMWRQVNEMVTTSIKAENVSANIETIISDYGPGFKNKIGDVFSKSEEIINAFMSTISSIDS